jgi:hypothetical protein
MMQAQVEPWPWPRRRWWTFLVLAFASQVALIFWLSERATSLPRPPAPPPILHLAPAESSELLALTDPTLFALPHVESFSGLAWMQVPPRKFPSFQWTETPRWLPLPTQELGAAFSRFIKTNAFSRLETVTESRPELIIPEPLTSSGARRASRLELQDGLTQRPLLTKIELPSWPFTDLLTNTVVQLLVDASGQPVSPTLLTSSGLKEADQFALDKARATRFQPVPVEPGLVRSRPTAHLTWGKMVFEWHTVPIETNTPPEK